MAPSDWARRQAGSQGASHTRPQIDENRQREYVYMIRDLGARRQPPAVLTIGGGLVFLALCYLLNRRDRIRRANLEQPLPPVKVEATAEAPANADASDAEREKVDVSV